MAFDGLLTAITKESDAEAERILATARSDAARIRADADARAEQQCAEAVARREAELRARWEVRRSQALQKARTGVLLARERFLNRVFNEAAPRFGGIFDSPQNAPAFDRLVTEALDYFADGRVAVRCRSALAARLAASAGTLGRVRAVADDSTPEGAIVESEDGSVRIDNTLAARLRRMRPRLSIELMAALKEST